MFQGNPKALKAESCLTGRFIAKSDIQLNKKSKKILKKIIIKNARENNLKNLNIPIPLGVFVVKILVAPLAVHTAGVPVDTLPCASRGGKKNTKLA